MANKNEDTHDTKNATQAQPQPEGIPETYAEDGPEMTQNFANPAQFKVAQNHTPIAERQGSQNKAQPTTVTPPNAPDQAKIDEYRDQGANQNAT